MQRIGSRLNPGRPAEAVATPGAGGRLVLIEKCGDRGKDHHSFNAFSLAIGNSSLVNGCQ